jgi:hypothetical protein
MITQVMSCLLLEPAALFEKHGELKPAAATVGAGAEAVATSSAAACAPPGVGGPRVGAEQMGGADGVLGMKSSTSSSGRNSSHSGSGSSGCKGSKLQVHIEKGPTQRMKGSAVPAGESKAAAGSEADGEGEPSRWHTVLFNSE